MIHKHILRLLCFGLLICGLHLAAGGSRAASQTSELTLAIVQAFLPQAASITQSGSPPVWQVDDSSGNTIALCCLTSPQADKIVGYAGPNNILLIMNPQSQVTQARWLQWLDTQDHVERVQLADDFWQQFVGRSLGTHSHKPVDGVSGATLTSLAIAEAIDLRLSGKRPSLRFPQAITIDELQSIYPEAERVEEVQQPLGFVHAVDGKGKVVGRLLRTGPLVDDKIGYQGPVELLLAVDEHDRVTKVKLRGSYDNEPYVRYSRLEASFWAKFTGRTLQEISQIDLNAEGIEGVSGATMTSMAAAETIVATAQRHLEQQAESADDRSVARPWNWSTGEVATSLIALLLMPWSLSRLRGHRRWRMAWQVLVLVVMVGLSGNLISMALLAGWTRSLPPVALAPGLCLLVVVSIGMSAFFGRNVYCDHVCPHGIAQQWLARWQRSGTATHQPLVQLQVAPTLRAKNGRARRLIQQALQFSAALILMLSVGWVVWTIPGQLTFFEPFDVYAWRVGWSVSLGIWLASILLAAKVPMGYCRLACPTGMLLESIRRKRAGRVWQLGDMLLLALTAAIWLLVYRSSHTAG